MAKCNKCVWRSTKQKPSFDFNEIAMVSLTQNSLTNPIMQIKSLNQMLFYFSFTPFAQFWAILVFGAPAKRWHKTIKPNKHPKEFRPGKSLNTNNNKTVTRIIRIVHNGNCPSETLPGNTCSRNGGSSNTIHRPSQWNSNKTIRRNNIHWEKRNSVDYLGTNYFLRGEFFSWIGWE